MNSSKLREFIEKQDLLQSDLAILAGVTERQVRSWLSDKNKIPIAVSTLLTAIEEGKLSIGWVAKANLSK